MASNVVVSWVAGFMRVVWSWRVFGFLEGNERAQEKYSRNQLHNPAPMPLERAGITYLSTNGAAQHAEQFARPHHCPGSGVAAMLAWARSASCKRAELWRLLTQ